MGFGPTFLQILGPVLLLKIILELAKLAEVLPVLKKNLLKI